MQLLSWHDVKKERLNERLGRKVIHGEKVTLAQIFLAKDAVVPTHHHESEQMSCVLEGSLKFELEGVEIIARPGDVLQIPSNAPHSARALEDSVALDVFSPSRLDWLTGKDDYLRR
jgi:quercetin dioxygenase-like cupin family protein